MKKILIILTMILTLSTLSACTKDEVDYNEYNQSTTNNNEFNKLVVNSIEEINRQSVLSDPKENETIYSIPGYYYTETAPSKKNAIKVENESIFNFDKLDSEGFYYLDGVKSSTQLFKHRGADTQLPTYLSDDKAVIKDLTLRNTINPTSITEEVTSVANITGLYAPAGELIKIEISEELASLNPIVYIGATTATSEFNDIPEEDSYSRMPYRVKELVLTDTVNYVGSPLGGQIYIKADVKEYNVKITGAVEYMHYVHNESTLEDLLRLYDSTAPMFEIEIPNYFRINMPRSIITSLEEKLYEDSLSIYELSEEESNKLREECKEEALNLIIETTNTWKLYAELSASLCEEDLYRSNYVTFLYDSYLGTFTTGKATSVFSINDGVNFIEGNNKYTLLEEFNKHFWDENKFVEQGSSTTITTLLSILSETLYGTYGEYRTQTSNSHIYSDGAAVMDMVNNKNNFDVAKYVTLVHSFGAKTFVDALSKSVTGETIQDRLYEQFTLTTGLNMEYYFETVLNLRISETLKTEISNKNYEMYIPTLSSLQIGTVLNDRNIYTVQNFGAFENDLININESIKVPTGMDFEIVEVSNCSNVSSKDGIHYYSTNKEVKEEFTVTVKTYNDNYSFNTKLIMGVGLQYHKTVVNNPTTTYYNNKDNTPLDDVDYSQLEVVDVYTTFSASNMGSYINLGNEGIFVTYAEMFIPNDGVTTFNVKGRGEIKVSIGENYNDLELVARHINHSNSTSSFDINDESRTFKLEGKPGEKVIVKVEVCSSVRVEYYMGYAEQGKTEAKDVPDQWWCGKDTAIPHMSSSKTNLYDNPDNLELDEINYDELNLNTSFQLDNSLLAYTVDIGMNGVFVTYAELKLPENRQYDFNIRGFGDIKVSIGDDFNNLKEVVRYSDSYKANEQVFFNKNDDSRCFSVIGSSNTTVKIKIEIKSVYMNATQERAYFELGYIENDFVTAVPSDWWYQEDWTKEVVSEYYNPYYTESIIDNSKIISSYTRVDESLNIIYQTGKLDDKFLTTPNSDKQSIDPGSIVIYKYDQAVTANYFAINCASSTTGVLSFFEIHVSNNGVDFTEAFKGINANEQYTTMALNKGYTFRYVKLVFASQYTGNYIDICNFEFQLRTDTLQITELSEFMYTGQVNLVNNKNNLNSNVLEFNDRVKFSFTGTSVILFSNTGNKYGVIEVKVNGITYIVDLSKEDSYSKQVLTLACMEYNTYDVEIRVISGLGNIDFIALDK